MVADNRYHDLVFLVEESSITPSESVNMITERNEAGDVTGYIFAPKDPELTEFKFTVKIPPDGLLQGVSSGSAQGIVAVAGHFSSSADFSFKNVTWPEDLPPNWVLDSSEGGEHEALITVTLNSEHENAEQTAELELDGEGSIQTLDWSSHQRKKAEEEEQSAWEMFSDPDGVGRVQALDNPPMVSFSILSVELKEVSFSGTKYHTVKKDDSSGDYTAPHWQDNSSPLDGDADDPGDKKYPICFTRNTKMKVSAKWHIEPSGLGVTVKMKGDGPGNLDFPETTATISGNDLTITDVECSNPFVNEVDFFDPMSIAWSFSVDGGSTWCDAGTSANQTYVTLGDPLTTVFHTLAHLGCKNADGESSVAGTADGVYGEFTDRVVRRLLDNKQMTYWFNNQMGATETVGILQRSDANGNCQAWSALVRDSFKVQGISADRIRALPDSAHDWSILVKDWQINDPPSGSGSYPYIVGTDAFDQNGVPGQGNANPPGAFNGHWITLCNGCYYDGSYGTPKVTGADKDKDYEDGSLDGYGASLPPSTGTGVRKNDVSAGSLSELDYQVDN